MTPAYTDRLIIRCPNQKDLNDFLAYRNAHANMRLQAIELMGEADALAFLANQAERAPNADNCWLMFALELRTNGRMIGEVGMYIDSANKGTGDIGWSLNPEFCGLGYATEAAKWLLGYAFEERQLHRVTANMSAQNLASLSVTERLGMRHEGMTRASIQIHGSSHDEHRYAILRDEWLRSAAADKPLGATEK